MNLLVYIFQVFYYQFTNFFTYEKKKGIDTSQLKNCVYYSDEKVFVVTDGTRPVSYFSRSTLFPDNIPSFTSHMYNYPEKWDENNKRSFIGEGVGGLGLILSIESIREGKLNQVRMSHINKIAFINTPIRGVPFPEKIENHFIWSVIKILNIFVILVETLHNIVRNRFDYISTMFPNPKTMAYIQSTKFESRWDNLYTKDGLVGAGVQVRDFRLRQTIEVTLFGFTWILAKPDASLQTVIWYFILLVTGTPTKQEVFQFTEFFDSEKEMYDSVQNWLKTY
jgi:hypothetical protein